MILASNTRKKIRSGYYEITVSLKGKQTVYFARRGHKFWWLKNAKNSPISACKSLSDAEWKARDIVEFIDKTGM